MNPRLGSHTGPEAPLLDNLPVVLRPAREPDFRQDRARRSYLALLDAATALFSVHGYDAVGTPEIAQRAGVSVGTFYRYFTDKHEIYLEIARRTMVAGYHKTIANLGPERFAGRARPPRDDQRDHRDPVRPRAVAARADPQLPRDVAARSAGRRGLARVRAGRGHPDRRPDHRAGRPRRRPRSRRHRLGAARGRPRGRLRPRRPPRPAADQRRARPPGRDRLHRARDLPAVLTAPPGVVKAMAPRGRDRARPGCRRCWRGA